MRPLDVGRFVRLFLVLLTFGLSVGAAYAQGGGGGFGGLQGGQGGRMGNGLGDPKARPEDEPDERLWSTRTAVLTPGDRVEYKVPLKKGDTLFAAAQSDAFDPALSVVDPKGKELSKNDDREEGDQSPFIEAKAPEDGTYLLKVLSFRSAAGGKFSLKIRTFTPIDAKLETELHATPGEPNERLRLMVRFAGKKGTIYDLRQVVSTQPQRSGHRYFRTTGPTGVFENDYRMLSTPDGTPVLEALKDGDFYAEYSADQSAQVQTDYREVKVVPAKPTDALTIDFAPGEIKVVEMPVLPKQIIQTTLSGRAIQHKLTVPSDPNEQSFGGDPTSGNRQGWIFFRPVRDQDNDVVRIFKAKETARFMIRSTDPNAAQQVKLTNSETLPEWKSGTPINGQMAIGEARIYSLTAAKSELSRISIKATQFLAHLDIFQLDGTQVNSLMDRATNNPIADLYYANPETFIVRVTCEGYGGSGPYTMTRDTAAATPYALGVTQTIDLDGKNFRLYSIDLEAGKRYQLIFDHPDHQLLLDIIDEDGQFIGGQTVNFDSVAIRYFVPVKSGKHRLWFRGEAGQWHIKIEPHTPPGIG